MRIERIHIDGFGIFQNYDIELTSGITVFLGPNEAGKTTLLAFIRAILFGFPDRRSKQNSYPPLNGGRHGGRISLVSKDDVHYIIERFAGPKKGKVIVTYPDGTEGGSEELNQLLGFASRDLFENVYAFGLNELQNFESLSDDTIRDRIYSAGTGGIALIELDQRLEKDINDLFRPSGTKSQINQMFSDIEEIRRRLRELEKKNHYYDQYQKMREALIETIQNIEQTRGLIQKRLERIKDLTKAWQDWTEFKAAEDELEQLSEVDNFPVDGVSRLEQLKEKIKDLEKRIEQAQQKCRAAEEELKTVVVDERLLKYERKTEQLQRGRDKYDSALKDLPDRQHELKNASEDLHSSLLELGIDWSEEKLLKFDTSIPIREEIRRFKEDFTNAHQKLQETIREYKASEERLIETQYREKKAKERLDTISTPAEKDRSVLQNKLESVRQLRAIFPRYRAEKAESKQISERIEDLLARRESIQHQFKDILIPFPHWLGQLFRLVFPCFIIGIIGFLYKQEWFLAGFSLMFLCLMVAVYVIFRSNQRRAIHKTQQILDEELKDLNLKIQQLENQKKELLSDIEKHENVLRKNGKVLGLSDLPEESGVESINAKIQSNMEELHNWEEVQEEFRKAGEELVNVESDAKKKQQAMIESQEEQRSIQEKWSLWLQKNGLTSNLTPDGALEVFGAIKTCREKLKVVESYKGRVEKIQKYIKEYEENIQLLLDACGRTQNPEKTLAAMADGLIEDLGTAQKNRDRTSDLRNHIELYKTDEKTFKEELKRLNMEYSKLLSQGGAEEEEEFLRNAEIHRKREEFKTKIRQNKINIERLSGIGEAFQEFAQELSSATPESLRDEEKQLDTKLKELEGELGAKRENLGSIDTQIQQLEMEEEVSLLRIQEAVLREKIQSVAEKWAILTLMRSLLRKARQRYERERQPGVVREAQSFFAQLTSGSYPLIFIPMGEDRIKVEDRIGRLKEVEELSRGTAEQLYLSLRFGFVREFSRRTEPLPVIIDEILVNFDPKRAKAACKVIQELAESHQVLIFTCHPQTAQQVLEVSKDAKVLNL